MLQKFSHAEPSINSKGDLFVWNYLLGSLHQVLANLYRFLAGILDCKVNRVSVLLIMDGMSLNCLSWKSCLSILILLNIDFPLIS